MRGAEGKNVSHYFLEEYSETKGDFFLLYKTQAKKLNKRFTFL